MIAQDTDLLRLAYLFPSLSLPPPCSSLPLSLIPPLSLLEPRPYSFRPAQNTMSQGWDLASRVAMNTCDSVGYKLLVDEMVPMGDRRELGRQSSSLPLFRGPRLAVVSLQNLPEKSRMLVSGLSSTRCAMPHMTALHPSLCYFPSISPPKALGLHLSPECQYLNNPASVSAF